MRMVPRDKHALIITNDAYGVWRMDMLIKCLVLGALITLSSVTFAHAGSKIYFHGPSLGLSIGSGGTSLSLGHGYSKKYYSGNRFKSPRFGQRFNRGYSNRFRSNGIGSRRFLNNRGISRGGFSRGSRIFNGRRLGGHRRFR